MSVDNKILRVQLRDGALTNFDSGRIHRALLGAARSVGGFGNSRVEGVNDFMFVDREKDDAIAAILSDMVVMGLNMDPRHHVPNFPPHIEKVQDIIVHVLRSYGFVDVADVYDVYRWGKHWVRAGVIPPEQFVHNGYPDEKLKVIRKWNSDHGCDTVAGLNELTRTGRMGPIIEESTVRYESELDEAVSRFVERLDKGDTIRVILVAGPSSSGKTTTTLKVRQKLIDRGLKIKMMNLDDYFWPVNQHPTDWIADRDFETPHALDYNLINRHLKALLEGQEILMPAYDFKRGIRVEGERFKIEEDTILLLDCLHGLYPHMTTSVPASMKFKIYLENLNVLGEGLGQSGKHIRLTDVRILRRMVRDQTHRNHPALNTVLHWEKVRKSELASIIPFWGTVDTVVNGGLPFEIPALKPLAMSIFPVEADFQPYSQLADARIRFLRLKELLASVEPLDQATLDSIPGDSVIREFIGGSTMKIPHND